MYCHMCKWHNKQLTLSSARRMRKTHSALLLFLRWRLPFALVCILLRLLSRCRLLLLWARLHSRLCLYRILCSHTHARHTYNRNHSHAHTRLCSLCPLLCPDSLSLSRDHQMRLLVADSWIFVRWRSQHC